MIVDSSALLAILFSEPDASLPFSPRSEAKCVRGPSGRGASRPRWQLGRQQGFSRNTRHESRNMAFPSPSGDSRESNPKPGQRVFHETRNTRHETRPFSCVLRPSDGEKCRLEALLTVRAAARFLGVSPSLLYSYIDRKQIPHNRMMGLSIRFRLSMLAGYGQFSDGCFTMPLSRPRGKAHRF